MAWFHCLQRETVHIYTRRQPRQARHEQWRLGCNQLPDQGFQQAAPRAECTASPLPSTQARSTCHRATCSARAKTSRSSQRRYSMRHECVTQLHGRAPGRGGQVHLQGAATGQLALLLSGACEPPLRLAGRRRCHASLLRVPPGVILDRAAIQVRGRQAALGDAGCHCGPLRCRPAR